MDWLKHFHFSLTDVQGLLSRRTVTLVLMAVLIYQGVGIFYKVLTLQLLRARPAPTAEVRTQTASVAVREPAEAYRGIPERNLFGTTTKAVTDKQAASLPQQDIALLIDLKGTVAGEGRTGFAIVEEKGTRKQRLVKTGDVIAGAKLVRIKRNAVDVLIDGQERTVKMVETKEAPILPPGSPAALPRPAGPAPGAGEIVVNRTEIGSGLQDMGSLLRQAQVRPFFNAGVPDGFMISNIQGGSVYQKMGMVDGDILQGVDGRKIQTADDMMSLFNTLKNAPSLSLSIRRGGRQETLNYQFR